MDNFSAWNFFCGRNSTGFAFVFSVLYFRQGFTVLPHAGLELAT